MIDPNELPNGNVDMCTEFLDDIIEEGASDGDADEQKADILVILGQLDPTELIDGKARWTQAQSKIILAASDALVGMR